MALFRLAANGRPVPPACDAYRQSRVMLRVIRVGVHSFQSVVDRCRYRIACRLGHTCICVPPGNGLGVSKEELVGYYLRDLMKYMLWTPQEVVAG